MGCALCLADDAERAWSASRTTRLGALVEESHFSVQLTACSCGQRFVTVFTERIDWSGGEDDQTWVSAPVDEEEARQLEACAVNDCPALVVKLAGDRRFLVRFFPTGGTLGCHWRERGLRIGPHD